LQLVAREQRTITVSSFASKIPQKYHTSIVGVGIILHDGSKFKTMASTMTQLTLQIKYMQLEGYQSSRTEGFRNLHGIDRTRSVAVLGSRTDSTDLMDDEESYEQFEKSIKRNEEGRYAISWPWKSTDPKIESNFGLTFDNRTVPSETPCFKYYIPHLPVISPDKQSIKLRIVFDASAVSRKGYSLKDQLYKGPTPIPHLAGIILRLRLGKFILMADIEKAFL
uniref:Reverse transcriptase domain-containing protein n=1 Tax=Dracunculus medinensis TaxID=318479 RepID=A0A0N4UFW5_DRAME